MLQNLQIKEMNEQIKEMNAIIRTAFQRPVNMTSLIEISPSVNHGDNININSRDLSFAKDQSKAEINKDNLE